MDKQLVIITGGSGALGYALALRHLAAGDAVVITGRNEIRLKELRTQAGSADLHIYRLDVSDYEAVKSFAAWIQIRFGRCDFLYNNAGVAVFKPFAEMTLTELAEMFQTNVDGVLYMTRAFLPMMQRAGRGHIINIASLAGQVASAKAAVYAASKAAIIRFSEGLRQELNGTGIHVTCVMPGPIDTPFLEKADAGGAYRQNVQAYLLSPEHTARAITRAVAKKQAELRLPWKLSLLSMLYSMLPQRIKRWVAPLINRK
ncbi:SDR family NAD(P)-dependent oxidoreductase [Brevibacillus fluminis]|uniref:SDR family NAD(P)-dependent oxidoreductase n=1 Tax=Brevibacillus fluminis TaxID=511487 RepID=UPI003F89228B